MNKYNKQATGDYRKDDTDHTTGLLRNSKELQRWNSENMNFDYARHPCQSTLL